MPRTLADLTSDGDLRALLERRSEDLPPGGMRRNIRSYGGDDVKYVRTFRAFVLAEWEFACEEKARLNLSDHLVKVVRDDSALLGIQFPERTQVEKQVIEFEVPSSHVSPSVSDWSTVSDCTILVGDRAVISYSYDNDDEDYFLEGRVICINDRNVSVSVRVPNSGRSPFDGPWDRFECDIEFYPCDAIFVRQALALDLLRQRPPSDFLRQVILGHACSAPGVVIPLADASYSLPSGSFNATRRQTEAVARALSQPFTIIQGPPGTGKTKTIAAMVVQLLKRPERYGAKILVCGTSNASVQNLAAALLPAVSGSGKALVWLASASRDIQPSEGLPPEFAALAYWQMLKDTSQQGESFLKLQQVNWEHPLRGAAAEGADVLREGLERKLCSSADVICCTLETAARDCLVDLTFKTVIMDEATQAVEPSALIPLIYGAERVVLVGDQCQLGPVVRTRELEDLGYNWSLFERMIDAKLDYMTLDRQFRMHPEISAFANRQFYEGKIVDGLTADERMGPHVTCFPNPKVPILFIDSSGDEEKVGRSFANRAEAQLAARVVTTLLLGGVRSSQIGIISPYRPQVQLLEESIRPDPEELPGLKIATVDSFQGGECDYIVMSCVRTGPRIGFVKDTRRMNVSLTRARYGLIIIGCQSSLSRDSADWKALCSHFAAKNAILRG
jgi:regulator of nonsense transcripts 1